MDMTWGRTTAADARKRRGAGRPVHAAHESAAASSQQFSYSHEYTGPGWGSSPQVPGPASSFPPPPRAREHAPPAAGKRKNGLWDGWGPGAEEEEAQGAHKKARLADGRRGTGTGASTGHAAGAAQRLPVEIWHRIFTYLPPRTLGRLLLVDKRFHGWLDPASRVGIRTAASASASKPPSALPVLRPDAIWQASRRLFWPRMPAPLRGRSELEMWRLLCCVTCRSCGRRARAEPQGQFRRRTGPGPKGVIPIFPFFITACGQCLLQRGSKEIDVVLSASLPYFLLPSIPSILLSPEMDLVPPGIIRDGMPPEIQLIRVFWPEMLEQTKAELEEVLKLGAAAAEEWYKGRETRRGEFLADVSRWETWFLFGGWDEMRERESAASSRERVQTRPPPAMPSSMRMATAPIAAQPESTSGYASPGQRAPASHERKPTNAKPLPASLPPKPPAVFEGGQERTLADVDDLKAQRRADIEKRASQLEPPIPPALLVDIPCFRDAVKEAAPLDDAAWALLKPQLLAQRWMTEHRERNALVESPSLPNGREGRPQAKLDPPPKGEESRAQEKTQPKLQESQAQTKSDPKVGESQVLKKPDPKTKERQAQKSSGTGVEESQVRKRPDQKVEERQARKQSDPMAEETQLQRKHDAKAQGSQIQEKSDLFPNFEEKKAQAKPDLFPQKVDSGSGPDDSLAEALGPVRTRIVRIATDIINKEWDGGRSIQKNTCSKFATDVLYQTAARYFAELIQEAATARGGGQKPPAKGPQSLSRTILALNDMRWLYHFKISPLTASSGGHLFFCSTCEKGRQFTLEGVVAHAASKHIPALRKKNKGVVDWSARWPRQPIFIAGTVKKFTPIAASSARLDEKQQDQQSTSTTLESARGDGNTPSQGREGLDLRNEAGQAQFPFFHSHLKGHRSFVRMSPDDTYRLGIEFMGRWAASIWRHLSTVQDLPSPVSMLTIVHHIVKFYQKHHPGPAALEMFYDAVFNDPAFVPLRILKGLACKACKTSPNQPQANDEFDFVGLVSHFYLHHGKRLIEKGQRPQDWRTNMVWLPEEISYEGLRGLLVGKDGPQVLIRSALPLAAGGLAETLGRVTETWQEYAQPQPIAELEAQPVMTSPVDNSAPEWSEARRLTQPESMSAQERPSPRLADSPNEKGESDGQSSDEARPRLQSDDPPRQLPSESPPEHGMQAKAAFDAEQAGRAQRAESVMRTPISRQERHETARLGSDQDMFEPGPRHVPGRGRRSVSPQAAHAYGHGYRERSPAALSYARHPYDFEARYDHPRAVPPYTAYEVIEVQDARGDYIIRRPIRIDDRDMMAYASQSRRETPWYPQAHPYPNPLPHPGHHPHAPPLPAHSPYATHRYVSGYDLAAPLPPMERQYSSHGEYFYPPRAKSPDFAQAAQAAPQPPNGGSREGSVAHPAGRSSY